MKSEHKFIVKKVKLGKDDKKLSNDHESQIVDPFSQLWEYNNTISQYNNNNNNNNINNSNNNNNNNNCPADWAQECINLCHSVSKEVTKGKHGR